MLRAQRDLGIEVPDGAVDDYERVIDQVDLASIAARERVTRHDVKARIEEFNALAGHEQVHKGMTSPRPHRERRAAADPALAASWSGTARSPCWPGWAGWPPSTPSW